MVVCNPMAKSKTTNEDGAQVRQRLMQALEDSICAVVLPWLLCHTSSSKHE